MFLLCMTAFPFYLLQNNTSMQIVSRLNQTMIDVAVFENCAIVNCIQNNILSWSHTFPCLIGSAFNRMTNMYRFFKRHTTVFRFFGLIARAMHSWPLNREPTHNCTVPDFVITFVLLTWFKFKRMMVCLRTVEWWSWAWMCKTC